MAAIDGLLDIVVEQGGDQLVLQTDTVPLALAGDRRLRLTLPAMGQSSLRAVVRDLVAPHVGQLSSAGTVSFPYASSKHGPFAVTVSGSLEDGAKADVRIARGAAGSSAPTAEPQAAQVAPAADSAPVLHPETSATATSIATSTSVATATAAAASRSAASDRTASPSRSLAQALRAAIAVGATDLHVVDGQTASVRVDGSLQAFSQASADPSTWLEPEQLEAVRSGHAVDVGFQLDGVRVRANYYLCELGIGVALRLLQRSAPHVQHLGLPRPVVQLGDLPHGLVLVCGHSGAGKSTTLAALVHANLQRAPKVCVTLEQPIEYVIDPGSSGSIVRQREVGVHVRDFETGLRDALREDPDLLLIGEMRDPDTIALALTAAETGHLVMSSLHSRGAVGAVDRIVDVFPGDRQRQVRLQLADSLRAVVAQRLLPRANGDGRVVAVEVLRVTRAVAHLIREGKSEQIASALHSGAEAGMLPLERHLADLVRSGTITRPVAEAATNSQAVLEQFLAR